jgi:23S rRNA pseudouridine2605 synthase
VVAIGRLDINTEGLLLLTNDGGLAKVIAHPDTGWLRRYRVRAHGEVTQDQLDRLRDGVTVDGMEYGPVEARLDRAQGDNVWITLGLREGKNREVKRILEHLGLSVNRLIRLSFGPFQLGDIEPGLVEEVRTRVLRDQLGEALAQQAGVDFESPVREPIAPFGTKPERDEGSGHRAERPKRSREDRAPAGRGRDEERPSRTRDDRSPRGARAEPERTRRDPLEPRRSVWRAPGEEPRPVRKAPRRGADPREARAQSAEREHERVGAITAGEGRKVLVERLVSTPAPEPAETPRRATAKAAPGADDRPRRPRTTGADRPAHGSERDEAPRSARPAGDRPSGTRKPAGANSDRPARPRRPEGASEERPYRARKPDAAGSDRPFRTKRPESPGADRPFRTKKPEGAGSDRPFRARKPEGAGADRPYRSRDGERSPRAGGDRPYRAPSRGDSPGRGGGDDRPRRGPPRGDGPPRSGPPGRGGAKGGAKGGGRGGPGGGRGGPRGRP